MTLLISKDHNKTINYIFEVQLLHHNIEIHVKRIYAIRLKLDISRNFRTLHFILHEKRKNVILHKKVLKIWLQ